MKNTLPVINKNDETGAIVEKSLDYSESLSNIGIREIEIEKDGGLIFFGTCHCSASSSGDVF